MSKILSEESTYVVPPLRYFQSRVKMAASFVSLCIGPTLQLSLSNDLIAASALNGDHFNTRTVEKEELDALNMCLHPMVRSIKKKTIKSYLHLRPTVKVPSTIHYLLCVARVKLETKH